MKKKSQPAGNDVSHFTTLAFRSSIDMVSGVVVGASFGYFGDQHWSYAPLGILIGFFLGTAAGFLNVYRGVKTLQNKDKLGILPVDHG